ncbi:hypothetical protein DFJ74DRAFT_768385 [Hyaloraphidium curvatum]|nr:hypothetical protein DFJ74DRAFT_768385 [Hyaloraphidium curvatum]
MAVRHDRPERGTDQGGAACQFENSPLGMEVPCGGVRMAGRDGRNPICGAEACSPRRKRVSDGVGSGANQHPKRHRTEESAYPTPPQAAPRVFLLPAAGGAWAELVKCALALKEWEHRGHFAPGRCAADEPRRDPLDGHPFAALFLLLRLSKSLPLPLSALPAAASYLSRLPPLSLPPGLVLTACLSLASKWLIDGRGPTCAEWGAAGEWTGKEVRWGEKVVWEGLGHDCGWWQRGEGGSVARDGNGQGDEEEEGDFGGRTTFPGARYAVVPLLPGWDPASVPWGRSLAADFLPGWPHGQSASTEHM